MTDYAPCKRCGEVTTESGYICFDCAFPRASYPSEKAVRQAREDYLQGLRAQIEAAHETLRDRFAMAALAGGFAWENAYKIANKLLIEREPGVKIRDTEPKP